MDTMGGVSSALPLCAPATCCYAAACASTIAVHNNMAEPEVVSMCVEQDLMIALAEDVLCMKADGKEQWCIAWLEWFWQEEIERAIWSIKQAEQVR